MTAEERAAELVERLTADRCQAHTDLTEWQCVQCAEQRIAEAIHAAEDDALERAAREVEAKIAACGLGARDCALCQGRADSAARIRSLKSGGSR